MFIFGYGTIALSYPPLSNIHHSTQDHIRKVKRHAQHPLRATQATMCNGHLHEHAACGHFHWFEPVQKCKHDSQSGDICSGHITTLSIIKTRIPARCDNCFDRAVGDIERNCNGCIAAVMKQVNSYDPDIKAAPNSAKRQALSRTKYMIKDEIREFERRRDTDIAELAREQGM